MSDAEANAERHGLAYAVGAYVLWGLFPIYWKWLAAVPSTQILAHRMVWSLLFVGLLLAVRSGFAWLPEVLRDRRTVAMYFGASVFLAINWGTYIWAVNAGFVVETSLGYFINPLINVVFGAAFLGERLRRGQWAAVSVALAGVAWLTWSYGQPPWIAVTLAVSFALYGLFKKKATLGALEGLGLETLLLFAPALGYLVWVHASGDGSFGAGPWWQTAGLMGAGVATALPLLLFAAAVLRLTLTVVGLLQYIGPTMQFLLGVYIYHEPFSAERLVGFVCIWAALVVFSVEGIWHKRSQGNDGDH